MKMLANLFIVLGFCLATLGAAGFQSRQAGVDDRGQEVAARFAEPRAVTFFLLGLAVMGAGVAMIRQQKGRRKTGGQEGGGPEGRSEVLAHLNEIRDEVVKLNAERASAPSHQTRDRIDALFIGPYFDLTSRNEELIELLGFADYARVWEGVASAERRLARCWTLCTDGQDEDGLAELPGAQEQIEKACSAMASLQ